MTLGAVLLLSGQSRRFGEDKLLYPFHGAPLAAYAMAALTVPALNPLVAAVKNPAMAALAKAHGFVAAHNEGAEEGVSASIRTGLQAVLSLAPHCAGCLFAVGDQPYLTKESVARLARMFKENPEEIVALGYGGRRGNPVVFPRSLFPALMALSGDVGGSALIRAQRELPLIVEAAGEIELMDVDTKQSLGELL